MTLHSFSTFYSSVRYLKYFSISVYHLMHVSNHKCLSLQNYANVLQFAIQHHSHHH